MEIRSLTDHERSVIQQALEMLANTQGMKRETRRDATIILDTMSNDLLWKRKE